jgi:CDP-paratose 2-epimerase
MREQLTRTVLITGGAGFIGCNLAQRLLADPSVRVRIFDNLSGLGVEANLEWLHTLDGAERLEFVKGDVRNAAAVAAASRKATEIYHLAAQTAATTSVGIPRENFEVNAGGTINVLEAARLSGRQPFVLFTSTNKVYGSLPRIPVEAERTHYRAAIADFCGVNEEEPIDLNSTNGCSKGAADQYVRNYARIYRIPTVVFRLSCIAGPRQFGSEDEGWVAHSLYSTLERRLITVYGDGFQVRDVLHVYDLIDAMSAARAHLPRTAGETYNVGGGTSRAISVLEMLWAIERATGVAPSFFYSEVRPGDQPLYVADTSKLAAHTGWRPHRSLNDTLDDIYRFWRSDRRRLGTHQSILNHLELVREVA